jgi:hypothetical protein
MFGSSDFAKRLVARAFGGTSAETGNGNGSGRQGFLFLDGIEPAGDATGLDVDAFATELLNACWDRVGTSANRDRVRYALEEIVVEGPAYEQKTGEDQTAFARRVASDLAARVAARIDKETMPATALGRMPVVGYSGKQRFLTQFYYTLARDLATKFLVHGSAATRADEVVEYRENVFGTTREANMLLDEARKYGPAGGKTSRGYAYFGGATGTPVEFARIEEVAGGGGYRLAKAGAASAEYVKPGMLAGGLLAAGLLGGGITVATGGAALAGGLAVAALVNKTKNSPAHESAHAVQFVTLGAAVERGLLTPEDFYWIQNNWGESGGKHEWEGSSEHAAIQAEAGNLSFLLDVIRERGLTRIRERAESLDAQRAKLAASGARQAELAALAQRAAAVNESSGQYAALMAQVRDYVKARALALDVNTLAGTEVLNRCPRGMHDFKKKLLPEYGGRVSVCVKCGLPEEWA